MLLKPNRARGKKEVCDAQVRKAWRNDICLCQAIEWYREFSKLTIDEQLDRIVEDMMAEPGELTFAERMERISKGIDFDTAPKGVNAIILRAAEVYWEVTGGSPRTVGTELSATIQLGENTFITLLTNLFEEEGLKPPSEYAITRVLRKKPIKKVVSNTYANG
jgi:hypothetical protein